MSAIKLVPVEYEDQVEYVETESVWLQFKYYKSQSPFTKIAEVKAETKNTYDSNQ